MTIQEILSKVDDITSPDEMSKQQAADFINELISDLTIKVEAIEQEIEEEEQEAAQQAEDE